MAARSTSNSCPIRCSASPRDRRIARDMDVVELAPHMRPAGDLGHGRGLPVRGLIERPETGIAVGLQEAVEAGQVRARMLALAIGRVAIDDRRRRPAPVGPFIAQIDPQPAGLGLAGARRQNRHRRVVGVQLLGRHDVVGSRLDQRCGQRRDLADPRRHDGAIEIDPFARVDAGLAIERKRFSDPTALTA